MTVLRLLPVVLLVTGLAAGCAGKAPDPTKAPVKPRVDVGHGSVNDIYGKLIENNALCNMLTMVYPPTDSEETATCLIDEGTATIVHFNDAGEAARFEASVRTAGEAGVFSDVWAMKLPTQQTAEKVAQALGVPNRTSG